MFFAYWWSTAGKVGHVGPHIRAQVFRTVPEEFVRRSIVQGHAVAVLL